MIDFRDNTRKFQKKRNLPDKMTPEDPSWHIGKHQPIPENWPPIWPNTGTDWPGLWPFSTEVGEQVVSAELICDARLFDQLHSVQDSIDQIRVSSQQRNLKDVITPTGFVGRGIFLDRAGIKLANIDRIFNVTSSMVTYTRQRDQERILFADLCGGPGAFTQYIQYRRRYFQGWGITLKGDWRINWHLNSNEADPKHFTIFEGPDGTGDIIRYGPLLVKTVKSGLTAPVGERRGVFQAPEGLPPGLDLVVADGWMEPREGNSYPNPFGPPISGKDIYRFAETINYNLISAELITAVELLRPGGHLVCKVMHTVTEPVARLIWLMARCFERITIFKPISSRAANAERYLICLNRRLEIPILTDPLPPVPMKFRNYLYQLNNFHLRWQLQYAQRLLQAISGNVVTDNLDMDRVNIFWRLPGVWGENYHDPMTESTVTGKRVIPLEIV